MANMKEKPTIIDFVEFYTQKFSEHVFLREKIGNEWTATTFRETREQAHRIGAGMMALGLQKGERVALLSQGRNLWVTGELGILYAGGVNVPLSIKLEESNDLLFRIRHSDARFIMTSVQQLHKIRKIMPDCPNVEKVIVFDPLDTYEDKEISIEEVLRMGDELLATEAETFRTRYLSVSPDDYANISYTSGTTADPKGILLTHRNYTANVEQGSSVIHCELDNVMLIILPLDHCFAHVAGFYTMMSYGGSIATVPVGKTAMATLKNIPVAIREVRPHVMLSVPALARNFRKSIESAIHAKGPKVEKLYNFALNNAIAYNREYWNRGGWRNAWRWPLVKLFDRLIFKAVRENFGGRMRFFVGGGALLDIALQRYFCAIGMPMFQGYGLSEATPIICSNSMDGAIFGSSGRIVKPMELKICDTEGNIVPDGEPRVPQPLSSTDGCIPETWAMSRKNIRVIYGSLDGSNHSLYVRTVRNIARRALRTRSLTAASTSTSVFFITIRTPTPSSSWSPTKRHCSNGQKSKEKTPQQKKEKNVCCSKYKARLMHTDREGQETASSLKHGCRLPSLYSTKHGPNRTIWLTPP